MSDIPTYCSPGRIYDFELPYHVPFLAIGFAVSKFKEIGVWDRFPPPIRKKTKAARSSWSGVTITKKDLDSLPDDVWLTLARELRLEWRQVEAA